LVYYVLDFMVRYEFEQIRDLPGKRISGNVRFVQKKGSRPCYVLESTKVENELGLDLFLDGTYTPGIPKIVFNFRIKGVGPICRVCINGRYHPNVGRTHKHDLIGEADPGHNLPNVRRRSDLMNKPLSEVWQTICQQAQILHDGILQIP